MNGMKKADLRLMNAHCVLSKTESRKKELIKANNTWPAPASDRARAGEITSRFVLIIAAKIHWRLQENDRP